MRHKHADWIIKFAEGVELQYRETSGVRSLTWQEFTIHNFYYFDSDQVEFRIKPREFIEGYYPVIRDGMREIWFCHGRSFSQSEDNDKSCKEDMFDWIGSPLPEIEWPENTRADSAGEG